MPPSSSVRRTARATLLPLALATLVGMAVGLGPVATGCTVHEVSGGVSPAGEDDEVRSHIAYDIAVPTFSDLAVQAELFARSTAELESDPTAETLGAAQDGWRALRLAWKQSRVLGFGPAKALEPRVDWPTADVARIEEAIASGTFDAASVQRLGSSQRGLLALEALLFDPDGGNVVVLDALLASPARRSFARALAGDLAAACVELSRAWSPDGGDFAGELAAASGGTFPTSKSAIDALVNESIFVVEFVLGDELAKPLGLRNDGTPQPELAIARRSEASLADAIAQLEGFQAIYTGVLPRDGAIEASRDGLSALVKARGSASLDADVRAATRSAIEALRAIPVPLDAAVLSHPSDVQRAYDAVRELKNLLSADVATKLGATLSFNDNDGD